MEKTTDCLIIGGGIIGVCVAREVKRRHPGRSVTLIEKYGYRTTRQRTQQRGAARRVRAQLINTRTRKLEMDFVLDGDARSFHVLNAVSPAWTCSLPFAVYVCDHVERLAQFS